MGQTRDELEDVVRNGGRSLLYKMAESLAGDTNCLVGRESEAKRSAKMREIT